MASAPPVRRRSGPVHVLAIGASTGGPNALAELVGLLPGDLGVPVLIVQHMPPVFTQLLAERLERGSRLKVREGYDGAIVKPGEAWVAPGDFHMVVTREGTETILRTNKQAAENSCRPAVDVLFRSVADVYGASALAVVLTGMGRDGTAGCQVLSKCGAGILVQDEASSVVWGMPRSVHEAGLAEATLNLKDLAAAVTTRIRGSSTTATALCAR
jgi:two-component system chemotaxis response regulator CheB